MAFHDVKFPSRLSFGASGGPRRQVEIVELASGKELRRTSWRTSKRQYDASTGLSSLSDIYEILSFFEAREGQLNGFRWKDWIDFKSCGYRSIPHFQDQLLGYGDGSRCNFQLVKSYGDGENVTSRTISKPINNTVSVGLDGKLLPLDDYELNARTGEVVFITPPNKNAVITAGFCFDVPVRFDCATLDINLANFEAGEIPSIPIVEIFE